MLQADNERIQPNLRSLSKVFRAVGSVHLGHDNSQIQVLFCFVFLCVGLICATEILQVIIVIKKTKFFTQFLA